MNMFKRRAIYAAVVATLAVFATGPATPVVNLVGPDGKPFVAFSEDEMRKLKDSGEALKKVIQEAENENSPGTDMS